MINIDYKNGIKILLDEYKEVLNEEIKEGLIWRYKIENRKLSYEDQQELLKDIIVQLLIQGRSAKGVESQINNINGVIGEWSIENVEKNLDTLGMSDRKIQKLREILQHLKSNSIGDWIIELHEDNNHIPVWDQKVMMIFLNPMVFMNIFLLTGITNVSYLEQA